jgi:hypothetical protein
VRSWSRVSCAVVVLVILVGGGGCGFAVKSREIATLEPTPRPARAGPTFVHHPRPQLSVSLAPFEDLGCARSREVEVCLTCEQGGLLTEMGCDEVCPVTDLLGGLEPRYPIAGCVTYPEDPDDDEVRYLRCGGGLMPRCMRYVIQREGGPALLSTEDELRDTYAPIETADEALGYAIAVTGRSAYFGLEFDPEYVYYVDVIEDTHVESVVDGYQVNLFRYRLIGCGPHETYALAIHVSVEGETTEESREPIYRDPREDDLCVD